MKTATQTQTDREFVISHVHYRIEPKDQKLTGSQLGTLYCMADGFGKRTPSELKAINGGYDWSHFRDSSDEAFREMARLIRFWLSSQEFDARWERGAAQAAAEQRAKAIHRLQTAQTRFLDNPSAENFILAQKEMLAYQELIKG